ncbi:serine hydrolase domain-containing protein, partial [Hyphomonas adhaerens]
MHVLKKLALPLLCLTAAACTSQPDLPPATTSAFNAGTVNQRISEYFRPLEQTADFSGTIRIEQGGRLVSQQSFGFADVGTGRVHTETTLYSAASVTKGVLAATLVMLEDNGALSLDESVPAFLPVLSGHLDVTIEDVLLHTAGLPRDFPTGVSPYDQPDGVAGWLSRSPDLISDPGEHSYSNVGYALLAEVVTAATGEPFAAVAKALVLHPNGMDHSFISQDIAGAFSEGAQPYTAGPAPSGMMAPMPAGLETGSSGLITTAADLSTWVRTLAEGKYPRLFAGDDPLGSIHKGEDAGGPFVSVQGTLPGYAAGAIAWPDEDLTISYVCNLFDYPVIGLNEVLRRIAFDEMPQLPAQRPADVPLDASHMALVGDYQHPGFGRIRLAHDPD